MPGLGTKASTLLITRGLATAATIGAGNTILSYGAGITPWLHLYIEIQPAPPNMNTGGGGGNFYSRPLQPGEIQNQWQPVPPELQPYVIPIDQEARYFKRSKIVNVTLKMGDNIVEKSFSISEKREKTLITVLNFANITREKIKVIGKNIKRVATRGIVKIRNLRIIARRDK